ncbi:hypothetical protein PoB_002366700 [Plakobranchus ocellatus]|uniref:Uncharacterized protein n=1 Tax=Plakobranchus ocellatus TaxID=259542 RepID=A0AAV3ZRL3_9GAST|nr:hypothetical protein PoB_002366700 [Plakobranchus ocellatus]
MSKYDMNCALIPGCTLLCPYRQSAVDRIGLVQKIGLVFVNRPVKNKDPGGGARTRDRLVPKDLRADSLSTVPSTPHIIKKWCTRWPSQILQTDTDSWVER